jgi:hypothetical protein
MNRPMEIGGIEPDLIKPCRGAEITYTVEAKVTQEKYKNSHKINLLTIV